MLRKTGSLNVADALYRATKGARYLNVFKSRYKADKDDIKTIAMISALPPDEDVLGFLKEVYINSENPVNRSTAVRGILHNTGYIRDPWSISEANAQLPLRRKLMSDDKEERKVLLEKFLRGEFDSYKE